MKNIKKIFKMENIIIMLNIKKLHVLNDRILLTIMKGNTVGD